MVYIIWGSPGSGKTTYAKEHMTAGDILIDFDMLFQALTDGGDHEREYSLFDRVNGVRHYLIDTIRDFPEVRHTWIVYGAPPEKDWEIFRELGAESVFIDTPRRECIRRCIKRGGDPEHWTAIVNKWFDKNEGKEVKWQY